MQRFAFAILFACLCLLFLFVGVSQAQSTPTPPVTATVLKDANLRAGPGTTYAKVGLIKAGQAVTITGSTTTSDWYQLDTGQWIAAFLVEPTQATGTITPTVTITATLTAPARTPTRTPTPTRSPTPRPTATTTPDPVALLTTALTANLDPNNRSVSPSFEVDTIAMPDGLVINVQWPLNDLFTINMIKKSAMMDAVTILRTIHDSGIEFSLINLTGTFELVDSYGNSKESPVLWMTISQSTMEQINWTDERFVGYVLYQHLAEIADRIKYHPALQE